MEKISVALSENARMISFSLRLDNNPHHSIFNIISD